MGEFFRYALVFIPVLGGMVVIHEFGHFIVAKFFGVRVDVFSVGFGKRLFGIKRGDTDYRLSLIPLGGYVKMAGENLDEERTGAAYEFSSKPKWQRFCIAIAGPTMNILTALAIPAGVALFHHEVQAYEYKPAVVRGVSPDSPAEAAGILPGDLIVKLDGRTMDSWRDVEDIVKLSPDTNLSMTINRDGQSKDLAFKTSSLAIGSEKMGYSGLMPEDTKIVVSSVNPGEPAEAAGLRAGDNIIAVNGKRLEQSDIGRAQLVNTIQKSEEAPVALTVERDSQSVVVTATPRNTQGAYRLGFFNELTGREIINQPLSLIPALKYSISENRRIIDLTATALGQVFAGKRSARNSVTGPVGIFEIVGQASKQGWLPVVELMGLLSLNLGIFNLLPIPVLDGGLIFMLILEAVLGLFGLPLTLRVRERMMQVGFVVLMLLMGFVIFNDISKSFVGSKSAQTQSAEPKPADK